MIFHHFIESDQTYLISARHSRILRILIHPKLPIKNPDSLILLKYTGILSTIKFLKKYEIFYMSSMRFI